MAKYTVQMISNICKLTPHTLRAWEKRYQVVAPERSAGGQRLYSQQDLEKLQCLQRLVERGHKISQLADSSLNQLRELLDHSYQQPFHNSAEFEKVEGLLEALRQYDLKSLQQNLESLKLHFSIRDYIFSVILPLFERVGFLVEQKKLNISQEHALSALTRSSLLQINPPILHPLPNRRIALATPEGNLHEMGIIMANILCNINQWETIYFGPNLPADALGESLEALDIPYLLLGGLYEGNAEEFKRCLKTLDNRGNSLKVVIGGFSKEIFAQRYKNIQVEVRADFLELESFLKAP